VFLVTWGAKRAAAPDVGKNGLPRLWLWFLVRNIRRGGGDSLKIEVRSMPRSMAVCMYIKIRRYPTAHARYGLALDPELLWRGAAGLYLYARVRAYVCWCRRIFTYILTYTYIHKNNFSDLSAV